MIAEHFSLWLSSFFSWKLQNANLTQWTSLWFSDTNVIYCCFLTIFKTDDLITKIPTEAKTAAQHCAPPPRLNMPSFIHDLNLWIQKDIWLWLLSEISLRASSCYLPNSPLMDDVKCAVLSIVPVVKNAENSWLRIWINSKSYPKAEPSVKFKCRSIDWFF